MPTILKHLDVEKKFSSSFNHAEASFTHKKKFTNICVSPCDPAWGHCYLHHECPLGGGAPEWMAIDETSYNGEKKECRFLYQLCRRGHNKRTMQWVRLRHGMAWHGRRDKGFFAVHLPCRLASTFIPVWPPLTLVAVNLWLAPSKALILGLLLKGFKDHNVVYLKCKDS